MDKNYDVVIVGCGVAGCFTALNLPKNLKILMITKSSIEESDSFLAQGGICVLRDENDYDDFFDDTLRAGHYENRRESVDIMIRQSREIIEDLVNYGVEFEKENDEFRYTREGGHGKNRILYHDDVTGKEITTKLLARVAELENVTLLDYTEMMDIICKDNECYGVIVKTKKGKIKPVFADYVMWACGGIGGIYENSTNFPHLTGDTIALSLKHRIKLQDVSYVQIHPTTLYSRKKERRFLISESVRGEGAILLDKEGNRFVNELLPRDLLTAEIKKQMEKDGTDHVWLSMQTIEEVDIKKRFPNIYEKCLEEGYDVYKDWIPVVPAQHYFMGGVYVDKYSKTTMNRLYASGETACNGVHGANRLASNSLLESLVFAKRAALHMTEEMKNHAVARATSLEGFDVDLSEFVDTERIKKASSDVIVAEIDRDKKEKEINETTNNNNE